MNTLQVIIWGICLLAFCNCTNEKEAAKESATPITKQHYVSIDGLWKSTSETALHLPSITLQPVIHIQGNLQNDLIIQGCFLAADKYMNSWKLSELEFIEEDREIIFHDQEGSTYIGHVNEGWDSISGMVYSGYPDELVAEDRLDFIRAENLDIQYLFMPKLPEKDGSISYTYRQPEGHEDGIKTGSVFEHIKDPGLLSEFMAEVIGQEYGRLESLLVVKDRQLVLEEYFYGYDENRTHDIHSCTKSIVSLLTGLAISENGNPDVNQSIASFFPEMDLNLDDKHSRITLHQVLTMTVAFQTDDSYLGLEQEGLVKQILHSPLEMAAGEQFSYNSECPYLLGAIIYANTGQEVDTYAKEKLFDPMGITNYQWDKEKGTPCCQAHIHLTPRDMARIGLLVLNEGWWKDQQIIPESWIHESTKPHVSESEFFDYGYQWWHRSRSNKSWWKEDHSPSESEHEMVHAMGWGGQYIFIVRDLNLVLITTASDYDESSGEAFSKVPMVIEKIVPMFE